ncbi:MAG TPA: glycosyltransferase family 4 protein [Anaerolineales bacterium]|nr:glycosyltransferase family 4 protein [Anaerolineales bacterium]
MTYNLSAMRLLFVADGRSPIAQNWIRYFVERGDEVYLASTFTCPKDEDFPLNGLEVIPVAFSAFKKQSQRPGTASARTVGLRTAIRQWFGPFTIRRAAQRLRDFTARVRPDLVHAMRIPYEGMMAADAYNGIPLIVSTWGNDFTLHAPSTRLMSHYTRWTMQVADALHADCHRDVRLAREWGFGEKKPELVAPGNGGIRSDVFYPPPEPVEEPVIINPRGFRPYVRNDVFFKAIPLVLEKQPGARFIFALMAGESQAVQWTQELNIAHAVELLPPMAHTKIAETFRRAQIVASPSIHDGTPNTLLEGIACGGFPIAGDLESIREWINPNENGLLFDSTNPQSIADAILTVIDDKNLRDKAAGLNQNIIAERAEYRHNMQRATVFYERILGRSVNTR